MPIWDTCDCLKIKKWHIRGAEIKTKEKKRHTKHRVVCVCVCVLFKLVFFIFFLLSFSFQHLFSHERQQVGMWDWVDGKWGGGDLGRVRSGATITRIYCMGKNPLQF